ncbi:hypothetical protein ACTXQV_65925, partial [Klebsiella pneumoniae]
KVLQSLMGHKSISSTEVYTKVFALDVTTLLRGFFLSIFYSLKCFSIISSVFEL